jgi:hypothetical protein
MDRRDFKPSAYPPGGKIQAEFRMAVNNINVQGTGGLDYLFFYKYPDTVLRLIWKLKRSDPEHPFFIHRVGVLNGKNIGPVPPLFEFCPQRPYHGNNTVYLGRITIAKQRNIHGIYYGNYDIKLFQ